MAPLMASNMAADVVAGDLAVVQDRMGLVIDELLVAQEVGGVFGASNTIAAVGS